MPIRRGHRCGSNHQFLQFFKFNSGTTSSHSLICSYIIDMNIVDVPSPKISCFMVFLKVKAKDDKLVVVIVLVVVVIVQQEDTTNEPFFSKSKKVTSLAEIGRQRWLKSSKLVTGVIKII